MNFTQSFRLAIKSLTTSKMRALLTMLGIIIGVGAVIVILSLGNGLTGMVQQQIDKMGINMIQFRQGAVHWFSARWTYSLTISASPV